MVEPQKAAQHHERSGAGDVQDAQGFFRKRPPQQHGNDEGGEESTEEIAEHEVPAAIPQDFLGVGNAPEPYSDARDAQQRDVQRHSGLALS